ncbi:MAG: helix-turn-helix domain-containing protein [Beijerinckiaceae bacterium]
MMTKPLPLALSVADAATALGIGKTKLFELISRGDLPAIRLGGRTLIRRTELEAFAAGLPARGGPRGE